MTPWPLGQKKPIGNPIFKYFTQDVSKDFWVCQCEVSTGTEDGDGDTTICLAKIKGMGANSNLGNDLEV